MFAKKLLSAFYYYLLVTTSVSFFVFISTFNHIHDGNKETATMAPAFVKLAQMMWGSLLALHASGLFAIIVLRRSYGRLSSTLIALFTVLMLAVFILPSLYFMLHLLWSSHGDI